MSPSQPSDEAVVVRLSAQPGAAGRVRLEASDGEVVIVPIEAAAGLTPGAHLDREQREALRAAAAFGQALDIAYRRLARRPRSRAEIGGTLAERGLAESVAEAVCGRLEELGLIDDAAFAAWWVAARSSHRPRGQAMLEAELRAKGVARDTARQAVEAVDETALATALARSRAARAVDGDRAAFIRSAGAYLSRRGFEHGVVRRALVAAWNEVAAAEEPPSALSDSRGMIESLG